MKTITNLFVALLLTAGQHATASVKPVDEHPQKSINYQLSFTKIIVEDDIELQLTQSCNRTMAFAGKEADFKNVNWSIKDGVLHLSSLKGSLKNKVRLNISVANLSQLIVKGESTVRSIGELSSDNLTVELNGTCFVSLRNKGTIKIVKAEGTELDVMKTTGEVNIN